MSKRNGDKARANRQQKQKMRQRKHSRALGLPLEGKTATRQLIVNGKADPNALEIVMHQVPRGGQND